MENSPNELRSCPTRIDGAPVLVAHRVSTLQCQDRQRGRYHKCYTCIHNNAWVAANGKPAERLEPVAAAAGRAPLG